MVADIGSDIFVPETWRQQEDKNMERGIIDFIQKVSFWLQLTPVCEFGDGGLLSASATVLWHCDDASDEIVISLADFGGFLLHFPPTFPNRRSHLLNKAIIMIMRACLLWLRSS